MNAYLIRCAIAARTVQGPAGQLSGRRSMAPKGLIEGPATEFAQTSSRVKSLVGLAVGAALLVTVCVSVIWRDRDAALAAKTFKETALVPQQVVAPSASTDVILAAIPQTEEAGVIVGVENLHETDAPPRDLATTELQVGKAVAAQELPAAPAGDSQIAVPEMRVRADGKAPLAPTVQYPKRGTRDGDGYGDRTTIGRTVASRECGFSSPSGKPTPRKWQPRSGSGPVQGLGRSWCR